MFVVYQILAWQFDISRFEAKVELNDETTAIIVGHDGGAFTKTSVVNLIVAKQRGYFFLEQITINSFDQIFSAALTITDKDTLTISMTTFNGKQLTKKHTINSLLNTSH